MDNKLLSKTTEAKDAHLHTQASCIWLSFFKISEGEGWSAELGLHLCF